MRLRLRDENRLHTAALSALAARYVRTVSAGLSVFRMNEDGRLTFTRTYDIDVGDKVMWWVGMVPL